MEKQRFYKAVSRPARFGKNGEYGRQFTMTFRADNSREARDHAAHCFRTDPRGLDVDLIQFIGTTPPEGMGELRLFGE